MTCKKNLADKLSSFRKYSPLLAETQDVYSSVRGCLGDSRAKAVLLTGLYMVAHRTLSLYERLLGREPNQYKYSE